MAVDYARIARDVAFTLEIKSPKIFENIFLNNGCLWMFGNKGRVKVNQGGNRFDERVHLGKNTNVGHQSKFTEIPIAYQNNWVTAQYGQSVVVGASTINLVEEDQNAGPHRITNLAEECVKELMYTIGNDVADQLMASSEGSNDPLAIPVQIPATAYGSQTTTTGGIARSSYPGSDPTAVWQTQYSSPSTAVDLSAAAGIGAASKFAYQCSPGGSGLSEQPDLGLTSIGVLAKATGGGDILRRYSTNDKSIKFGFDNIMINQAALIADRNIAAASTNKIYFINTNYAHIQVLAGSKTKASGEVKVIGDGAVSVPIQVRPPIESDNYLQYVIKAYMVYNLTFGGLRQHGHLANITEA